jgi:hypothetical protein
MYGALAEVREALETALRTDNVVPLVLAVGRAYEMGATDADLALVEDMPFGGGS